MPEALQAGTQANVRVGLVRGAFVPDRSADQRSDSKASSSAALSAKVRFSLHADACLGPVRRIRSPLASGVGMTNRRVRGGMTMW